MYLQLNCSGTGLARIHKSRKREAAADAGIQGHFAVTHDFHAFIADHKFATCRAIVATSAQSKIGSTSVDVLSDLTVALPVQCLAIAQVCSARHNKECA